MYTLQWWEPIVCLVVPLPENDDANYLPWYAYVVLPQD